MAKIKVEITDAQLQSIANLAEDALGMLGCGDPESDKLWKKYVTNIDRFLTQNGYEGILTK